MHVRLLTLVYYLLFRGHTHDLLDKKLHGERLVEVAGTQLRPPCIEFLPDVRSTAGYKLKLSSPYAHPEVEIWYSLDGTVPDRSLSVPYTGEVVVDDGTVVRARVFYHAAVASEIAEATASHPVGGDGNAAGPIGHRDSFCNILASVGEYVDAQFLPCILLKLFGKRANQYRTRVTTVEEFAVFISVTAFAVPYTTDFDRLYGVLKQFIFDIAYKEQLQAYCTSALDVHADALESPCSPHQRC